MTITTLESTTIEHLDFEPACERRYCDAPATHIYVSLHQICFRDCYLCTLCAEKLLSAWRNFLEARRREWWPCPRCGKELPCDPPAFRIEPLP